MANIEAPPVVGPRYKWVVLSNTTIGVLLSSLNATSLMIALPVIFRGIHLDPLAASNFPYLLWIMMGYTLATAVMVVTVGRIGDIFGRVRMYNLGFAWFTVASVLLSVVWSTGSAGAVELVAFRIIQGIGGALLFANSAAIITDAFPAEELGFALGTNMMASIVGGFLGILAGGLLSQVGWRWVFLANVPIGVFGTVWAYLQLKEIGVRIRARLDWAGNLAFAAGLAMVLTGVTYGIKPYGRSLTGWGDPFVLEMIFGGLALLVIFVFIEQRVAEPMFRLSLFRVKAFTAGNLAGFLGSVGRGGFQFMLMIWLQGIWLPQHGYDYTVTPLWAGIYMVPFSVGFVVSGPLSGKLSDRFGARPFAAAVVLLNAVLFALVMAFPANFSYVPFAVVMVAMGIAGGLFASPNTSSIMNSVPARHRGAASGMRVTFNNTGMPLSMGLFFTLLVLGLNSKVPAALYKGLVAHGVPAATATQLGHLPPLGYLFAAFLGLNPLKSLLGPKVLAHLPPASRADLVGRSFFPHLIGAPFKSALVYVLLFAIAMSLIAAVASALRGEKFIHEDEESRAQKAVLAGLGGEVSSLAEGDAPLAGAGLGAAGGLGAEGAEGSAGVTSGANSPPAPPSDASGPTGLGPTGLGPTDLGPTGLGPTGLGPTGLGPTGLGPTDLEEPVLSGRPRRHRRRGGRASHPGRGASSTG
jgi:MFS family permease